MNTMLRWLAGGMLASLVAVVLPVSRVQAGTGPTPDDPLFAEQWNLQDRSVAGSITG
jgi:hypothetical protein